MVMPALVFHQRKVEPAHEVVGEQWLPAQISIEYVGEILTGFRIRLPVKSGITPGRFVTFDYESAGRVVELVGMGNKQPGLVFAKNKR